MRLWLDGRPGLDEPPEELAEKAWRTMASWAEVERLPVYRSGGLSVRMRFVYELPQGPLEVRPDLPSSPAVPTLAWFWTHVLEGLLWESASQVGELHARREWGRVAGLEIAL